MLRLRQELKAGGLADASTADVRVLEQHLASYGAASLCDVTRRDRLSNVLSETTFTFEQRRQLLDWTDAERASAEAGAAGRACDFQTVLPLRIALDPGGHRSAVGSILGSMAMVGDEKEVAAAWSAFVTEAGVGTEPLPQQLCDVHLVLARARFVTHPVLGLLWATSQRLHWPASGADGWRHKVGLGVHRSARLRHAQPLPPGGAQTSVPQKVPYWRGIRRWARGSVVCMYGCAECSQLPSVAALAPRHIVLFEIDVATLSVAGRSVLERFDRLHISIVPLSFEQLSAAEQVRRLARSLARLLIIVCRSRRTSALCSSSAPSSSCSGYAVHVT